MAFRYYCHCHFKHCFYIAAFSSVSFFTLQKIITGFLAIVFVVVGFRGGIQYKPISIITASQYGSAKDASLILNTPFTILKTFGKTHLTEVTYFSLPEAEKISPVKK